MGMDRKWVNEEADEAGGEGGGRRGEGDFVFFSYSTD